MVKVLRSIVVGPLEGHVVGFAEGLLRQGYTQSAAEQHVCFIAHLDRWMQAEDVWIEGLNGSVIERYLAARQAAGYVEYRSPKALQPLLSYLAPLGCCLSRLRFRPILWRNYSAATGSGCSFERGVTPGTARGYVDCVRPFVAARASSDAVAFTGVTAADVTTFVLDRCPGRAVGSAKLIACALRSLLGWLHVSGQMPTSLATAVPSVAGWRLSGLPKGLEPGQLRSLLGVCDRRTPTGRRNYAIMQLLARLGLRAGEVARLGLDDLDWRHGEITVVGKGERAERLPLPAEVGAAIAAYLRRGRPATAAGRSVFVRVRAPHRALSSGGVTMVVFDAAQRAGLGKIYAHRLRHSAATAMLRAGSPLAEVGQVLRHRSALTTAIYAKVDRDALAVLARPWPVSIADPASGGVL